MKTYIIEDNSAFAKKISAISQLEINPIDLTADVNTISKLIYLSKSDDIIFINCEFLQSTNKYQNFLGIQILKLLRLRSITNHCIIYSFLSREQLMLLSSENLIVFSTGVTFLQLPSTFQNLSVESLAKRKAPNDLSAYFKSESRMPYNRHFFANWWGVKQLWNTYKNYNCLNEQDAVRLENEIFENAKDIDSYQGLLAQYLYQKKIKSSSEMIEEKCALISFQLKNIENHEIRLTSLTNEKKEQVKKKERILSELQKINSRWKGIRFLYMKRIKLLNERTAELSFLIDNVDKKIKIIEENIKIDSGLTVFSETQFENLTNTLSEDISQTNKKRVITSNNFVSDLRTKPPRILYIDDQASQGWSDMLQLMIYGEKDNNPFVVYQPEENIDIDTLVNSCCNKINNNSDLIILDLRLQGEDSAINDLSKISGISVLEKLRNGYKNFDPVHIPILIVTASNKSKTLQYINYLGADAYWIKEGLDNNFSEEESIDNYWDLIAKIFILAKTPNYLFLKEIREKRKIFKNKSNFWWVSQDRFRGKRIFHDSTVKDISKNNFIEILNDCISILESNFRDDLTKTYSSNISKSLPSFIAIRLFKILEDIHTEIQNKSNKYITIKEYVSTHHEDQRTEIISKILYTRNNAAHYVSINIDELAEFFNLLVHYLSDEPEITIRNNIRVVGFMILPDHKKKIKPDCSVNKLNN